MAIILFIISAVILFMLVVMSHKMNALLKSQEEDQNEKTGLTQGWITTAIVFTILAMLASLYFVLKGTIYEAHMNEWLNIIVRVMHITFGIAWIGASFYFVFLENALNRKENLRDELAGNLWAVHGGGFYYLEKYKVAPKKIPKHLHWFKYEAYFTWLSGFALLFIVYYFNASAMLVNSNQQAISPTTGIFIGIGSLIIGWIAYDQICKSPLRRNVYVFASVIFVLLSLVAFGYSQVFNGRAAYIHFGALLGTIMAANVFFVIIPSQKAMVNAAKKGFPPDPQKGKNALFRSIHNNYFTLPVLFVMVSNHFPGTFGNNYQWILLLAMTLATAGIKHWLNLRERGEISVWVMPVSIIILLAVAWVSAPVVNDAKCKEVGFAEINSIIERRCISCHSAKPTDKIYTAPPNGVVYDVPDDITRKKEQILQRVVHTRTMPLNNKTNMTTEEREAIRCWIEQGARIE